MVPNASAVYFTTHVTPGGILEEKLGGGVRPACQNPCPVYDQNLQYSVPINDPAVT